MKICLIEYTLKDRWENNTKLSFGGGLLKVSEYIYGKKNLYDDIILSDIIEISLLNISKIMPFQNYTNHSNSPQ